MNRFTHFELVTDNLEKNRCLLPRGVRLEG